MSAITAKASRKMKKYAVLTREPRCFLGSFDFSWEQRKLTEFVEFFSGLTYTPNDVQENGTLVLRSSNVSNGEVVDADNIYVNPQVVNSENVKVGDIVVVVRNGSRSLIGKHAQIKAFMPNTVIGAFMTGIRSECPEFTNALLNTSRFEEEIAMNMGATINQITGYMFSKMEFKVPCLDEQKKIGEYFEKLDNLITLHQRKCANLCSPSQVVFSLLFATSTFSWEQRKLSEITDKVTEKNAGLQYVETFTNSAEFGIISQRDFFDHDIAKLGSLDGYYIVKNEDFVYNPRISTSAPVGPINRNKLGRTGVMSPLYTVFRPHDIDTTYLEYFFKCGYWHSFMNFNGDSGARSDRFSIRDNVFFQMPIPIPDIDEQRKIGELLTCLDNLITLHQRECISFTGRADRLILTANKKRTTSSWEQRKFEEIAVRSSVICSDNTLPRVEYEDIVSGTGRLNKDIYAKQSIKSGIAFHQGDVLYGKLRPYLQNWLLPTFDGLAVGDFWVLQPQNADSSFLYRLIQSRQFDEVANQSTGTKMPRADWKLVSKTVFSIPSNISEQAAIGTYFTALDSLITLHQRKPFLMKWRTSDANRNQTNRLVL